MNVECISLAHAAVTSVGCCWSEYKWNSALV